ncbi:Gfo/Idh/MocA family oxidoreductase [bacterium]|nr:MAG: Gfo/Idh/MocA family oxidoreductase [bacterium]
MTIEEFPQLPELPKTPRPIVSIGAGGIVRDAHMPAYRIAGFPVHAVTDLDPARAGVLARDFGIPHVAASIEEAVALAPEGAVFDVAVPGRAILDVLCKLPDGAIVLMQKPMGETLADAQAILDHCRAHGLTAAVNFQMRTAPYVRLAREVIGRGLIGELHDVEMRVTTATPWDLWPFLNDIPRMEILYHSIHYLDTIRSFLGEPTAVLAKTMGHPRMPRIRQSRSTVILDYGDRVRATVTANHGHDFGPEHQESYIKWEGTTGAIVAVMGLNLDYPKGRPDSFEVVTEETDGWRSIPLQGSWFPHAFIGPMASLMRFADGEIDRVPTGVEDAIRTMAVVEAAFLADERGGVAVPDDFGSAPS